MAEKRGQYQYNEDGTTAQLTASSMEYYGPTVTQRPAANKVPVGAIYCAVSTQEYWQSDGTTWVVI